MEIYKQSITVRIMESEFHKKVKAIQKWLQIKIKRQNEYETVAKFGGLLSKHGLLCGPFKEVVVNVLLDSSTLQKFIKKSLCYVLDRMSGDLSGCCQIF